MANELFRLSQDLYNTPHLITQEAFERIEDYLQQRNEGIKLQDNQSISSAPSANINFPSGVGVLNVMGVLTYRATMFEALCGMMSYQTITRNFDALVADGVKVVAMVADGPGGQAYGMTETGRYLRSVADANGIKLVAYVDGVAASATYGLVSAAHEVIINPDALAGSIGVVVSLINDSKKLEQDGYKRTFIYAGDNKIPYASDGSFRKDFLQEIQQRVDMTYQEFTSYVADMRNISQEDVINTQASVFDANKALELNLVTDIKTRQEFNDYMNTLVSTASSSNTNNLGVKMDNEQLELLAKKLEETEQALALMQEQNTKLADAAKAKAISELTTKAAAWEFAGVDAASYATAAFGGSVPVEMFDSAMEQATKALGQKDDSIKTMKEQLENIEQIGELVETPTIENKKDTVLEAARQKASQYNVTIKGD